MSQIEDIVYDLTRQLGHLPWWAWAAWFATLFGGLLLPGRPDDVG